MTAIGLCGFCGFCGVPLTADGSRRCGCGRTSRLAEFALLVSGSAQGRGRDVPVEEDGHRAAAVVRPSLES